MGDFNSSRRLGYAFHHHLKRYKMEEGGIYKATISVAVLGGHVQSNS